MNPPNCFTPGEWVVHPQSINLLFLRSGHRTIATIAHEDPVVAQANGRLLCTAPRLYSALQALLADQHDPSVIEQARQALYRVQGAA